MENKIEVKKNKELINLMNLTTEQLIAVKNALGPVTQGYKVIKAQSFSQQKETFYNLQPELKLLSNSKLREEIEKQLEFGRICSEIFFVIEKSESEDAKAVSL